MTRTSNRALSGGRSRTVASQALLLGCGVLVGVVASTGASSAAVLLIALALCPLAVAVANAISLRALIVLPVLAVCVNGLRMPVAGFNLLPEHFVVSVITVVFLLRSPEVIFRPPAAFEALFLMWILWNGVVSVLLSPEPGRSLPIVGWLMFSRLMLWVVRGYLLNAAEEDAIQVRRSMLIVGAMAGVVAFALWISGLVGIAVPGVQPEPYTNTVAARGLSYEANILGSQELCILIVALAFRGSFPRRLPAGVLPALSLGILAAMTRAVWVATILVIGVEWLRRYAQDVSTGARVRGGRGWVFVLGLALVPFLVLSPGNPIFSRFRGSLDLSSETAQLRLGGVREAARDMRGAALLVGLGTNSYGQRHRDVRFTEARGYLSVLPLVVLYDTGLVGAVLLASAGAALVLMHRRKDDRHYARLLVLAIVVAGSGTNPIWFGVAWLTVAVLGTPLVEDPESALARSPRE